MEVARVWALVPQHIGQHDGGRAHEVGLVLDDGGDVQAHRNDGPGLTIRLVLPKSGIDETP